MAETSTTTEGVFNERAWSFVRDTALMTYAIITGKATPSGTEPAPAAPPQGDGALVLLAVAGVAVYLLFLKQ